MFLCFGILCFPLAFYPNPKCFKLLINLRIFGVVYKLAFCVFAVDLHAFLWGLWAKDMRRHIGVYFLDRSKAGETLFILL